MPGFDTHFLPLFDHEKNLVGVWLSPELWRKAEGTLSPVIDKALEELSSHVIPEAPENLKDWELLAQYWDYQYPLPTDVHCENCGSGTENWQADAPRKFKLRSATMGGLANFECLGCRARIIKKHFKHKVDVQCRPYVEK